MKNDSTASTVKRYGSVIGLKPELAERYIEEHANTWPGVLQGIREANIQNYSIYLARFSEETLLLFSYFEYTGQDFDADMAKLAADPVTQKWWALVKPMQIPLPHRQEGEWWADMEEVFHAD